MSEPMLPFSRGGMCPNPFGGEDRIDRVDLFEFVVPNAPPEKILYSCIIQDAASNYLYAFLGKNGTSIEEFFSAYQYFFKVVSTDRGSWDHHRTIRRSYSHHGERVIENHYLTDSELQLMCFDKHYDMSGLSDHMHIDKFRTKLKAKRIQILNNNWEQVKSYVEALYQHELSQIASNQQVPLRVWNEDLLAILVDPINPVHLASTIYVSNKLKKSRKSSHPSNRRARTRKRITVDGQQSFVIEGEENAQVADRNSRDSLHIHLDRHSAAASSGNPG